ncbi:hypothetical protein IV500_20375 [Paeniglutamicibacter antarcticus]|uniref:Uncharacterized protein n=1 Tax=Arthrobacter terrae TaxID=2935737 RepID=A0A931G6A3_9MICC|nr:hypothetical protein [Arthrobacter terrae]MBG0741716.1 hypothetical protein [Arthrobacter terrae]
MMDEEELVAFITADPLAWRIWLAGYESGLARGHDDERNGMENLADLIARRQLTLQACEQHIKAELANTLTMAEVRAARASTRPGSYRGGPVAWDSEGDR